MQPRGRGGCVVLRAHGTGLGCLRVEVRAAAHASTQTNTVWRTDYQGLTSGAASWAKLENDIMMQNVPNRYSSKTGRA